MDKRKLFYILAAIVTSSIIIAMTLNSTNNISNNSNTNNKGDFNELIKSGDAQEIKSVSLGDSKDVVSEKLGIKATESKELTGNEEYDYYEHYIFENGKKYDIYYKNDGVAGATAFY